MLLGQMIRVLDWNYQTPRLFGEFFQKHKIKVDNHDNINGIYDVIITHREGIQDSDFSEIEKYCHSKTKIICDITTESGNIQCFLDSFKKTTDTYNYEFYLIADTDLSNYFERVKVKYTTLYSFSLVFYPFLNKMTDNQMSLSTKFSSYENSFMSLNNSCRLHRILLLSQLLKKQMDISNCSFLFTTSSDIGYIHNNEVFKSGVYQLIERKFITDIEGENLLNQKLPKTLDIEVIDLTYISNSINKNVYKSIINLITENLFGITDGDITPDKIVTFTEKTIKPFQARQIPIFLGLPNLQETLRRIGFDLFDDLVNNDFEKEKNHHKRMIMAIDEVNRLLSIDLIKFKKNNIDRFEKNYNLLETLTQDGRDLIEQFLLNNNIFDVEK